MRVTGRNQKAGVQPFTVIARSGGDVVEITGTPDDAAQSDTHRWFQAHCLAQLLRSVLATETRTTITLDLTLNGEVTTSLLAVLIDAKCRARRSGTDLVIRGSPALHQLAEVCHLDQVLATA